MVTQEEKLELMDRLGMEKSAQKTRREIAIKSELDALTNIKLKPIQPNRIAEELSFSYLPENTWVLFFGLNGVASLTCYGIFFENLSTHTAIYSSVALFCVFNLMAYFHSARFTRVQSKPLADWDDPIPYSALLATQEAKDLGLTNFRIYYPVKGFDLERVPNNLIITGFSKEGVEFEIFACDDRKIYQ